MDTTPHWLKTAAVPSQLAPAGDVRVDVAVVGGGITGITAAYLAKKAGFTVALLERARCCQVDTGHTTAHLTAVTDLRLHQLQRRFGADAARHVWDAGTAAIARIEALTLAESIDCDFARLPAYLHAATRDENASELEREAEAARQLEIDAAFVAETPFFRVPGVQFPQQALIHPVKYLAGLLRAIPGGGSHVYEQTTAEEFEERSLKTSGGRVHFQYLILATHNPLIGDSSMLGSTLFQTKLSLYTTYALGAKIPAGLIPPGSYWDTHDPYHYLRVQQGGDGYDYAIHGGEDHKTGQEADTFAPYGRLEAHLRNFAPTAEINARWSGQVIETNDGLPFIGPTSDRQIIATGFSGNGMTFGTLGAMMAIDFITGATNPWQKLFDPSRTTVLGGTLTYLRENKDFPVCLVRDHLRAPEAQSLDEIAPGEGKILNLHGKKAAAYRDPTGHVTVCSAICTHLQCVVGWNSAEKTWDCPCHGSRFQPGGEVISGPAEEPLPRLSAATGQPTHPARRSA